MLRCPGKSGPSTHQYRPQEPWLASNENTMGAESGELHRAEPFCAAADRTCSTPTDRAAATQACNRSGEAGRDGGVARESVVVQRCCAAVPWLPAVHAVHAIHVRHQLSSAALTFHSMPVVNQVDPSSTAYTMPATGAQNAMPTPAAVPTDAKSERSRASAATRGGTQAGTACPAWRAAAAGRWHTLALGLETPGGSTTGNGSSPQPFEASSSLLLGSTGAAGELLVVLRKLPGAATAAPACCSAMLACPCSRCRAHLQRNGMAAVTHAHI